MKINDKIKKDNPFRVPDGYFDTLADRTMSAIRQSMEEDEAAGAEKAAMTLEAAGKTRMSGATDATKENWTGTETGKPVRRIRFTPYFSLAAAILGFALLATVMIRVVTGGRAAAEYKEGNSLYADLAAEELDTYMIEEELYSTEPADITGAEQTISSDIIIDYLMSEDVDLNDIYELL